MHKIQNTMIMLETHVTTIQNSELDRAILEALRASGDALKRAGIDNKLAEAEDVMSDVQEQVERVKEITNVIGNGSVTGTLNLMGDYIDDDELQRELDEMMEEDGCETEFMKRMQSLSIPTQEPVLHTEAPTRVDKMTMGSLMVPTDDLGGIEVPEEINNTSPDNNAVLLDLKSHSTTNQSGGHALSRRFAEHARETMAC